MNDTEDLCVTALDHHGYETYVPPKAKYREQDVFGLYDVLAFGHGQYLHVQVKGGRDAAGIQEWFERARVHEAHLDGVTVQFWHRKEGFWRVAGTTEDGYEWLYDGRETTNTPYSRLRDVVR